MPWSEPGRPRSTAPSADLAGAAAALRRGIRAFPPTGEAARLRRVARLAAAGAWTDLALELAAIEAAGWRLSRIVLDGDEWLCTLCRHPQLPADLDETVDGRDLLLPLAILDAVDGAHERERSGAPSNDAGLGPQPQTVPAWCEQVR